jgi:hypothetical protein
MPFGLGKKGNQQQPFITNITDKQDLEENQQNSSYAKPQRGSIRCCKAV